MDTATPYVFMRGQRGIFFEVYFPKKVAYQPEIFSALKMGLIERRVKGYLTLHLFEIREEMLDYLHLFDPDQYRRERWIELPEVSPSQAKARIDQYASPFYGWSMYEVDGTFLNANGVLSDERTQVIRLLFRFEHKIKQKARAMKCYDVFEAMLRWIMAEQGRLDHTFPWSDGEQERFLELHEVWSVRKLEFAERYYDQLARAVKKWMDDIALFIFGYLVRRFWVEVSKQGSKEDEIWTVSFFNTNLNIVKRQKRQKEEK
jgi:hypothetical protein